MAKLKKSNLEIIFCPTCKGNGFVKVGTEFGEKVHQCWDCDSEGEYYVHKPTVIHADNGTDTVTVDVNKLH
jgi:DnaJ-class molecular chaperone|tara:strand:- start:583 stop:795 length:213 start_codon:yes stop_codon:yes gene_type:complete